jgi:hypothetical protein
MHNVQLGMPRKMKPNLESPNLIERIMDVWKDEKR